MSDLSPSEWEHIETTMAIEIERALSKWRHFGCCDIMPPAIPQEVSKWLIDHSIGFPTPRIRYLLRMIHEMQLAYNASRSAHAHLAKADAMMRDA